MEFKISTADILKITDLEISDLLTQVYVAPGYTNPELAVDAVEKPFSAAFFAQSFSSESFQF